MFVYTFFKFIYFNFYYFIIYVYIYIHITYSVVIILLLLYLLFESQRVGTSTGGFEEFVAAEGAHVHVIDYHSGAVNHVFIGGGGKEPGHTGVVTCLLHDGKLIFSGSTDESIITWDSVSREKLRVLLGHEGNIKLQ